MRTRFRALVILVTFGASVAMGLAPGTLAAQQAAPAAPSLSLVFPTDSAVVRSTDIPVRVAANNFTIACDEAGMPDQEGTGHIHAMLDGMSMAQLTNFYCSQEFMISGQGVSPGQHTLMIDLATNTHGDMEDTAQTVTFLYQPTTPPAALPQPGSNADQSIQITAPASNATVPPQFTIEVAAPNFTPSCDLEGKPDIAGVGHYHIIVDEGSMPMGMPMDQSGGMQAPMDQSGGRQEMMTMPGMIAMPCTNSIPVDLSAWPSGRHTVTVELEQNDHTPMVEAGGVPRSSQIAITLQNPFHP